MKFILVFFLVTQITHILAGNGNDNGNGSGKGNGNANGDFNNDLNGNVPKKAADKVTTLATDTVGKAIPGGKKINDLTNNIGGNSGETSDESNEDSAATDEDLDKKKKPHKDDDGHFRQYPQYYSYNKGKNAQTVTVSAPSHSGLVSGLLGGLL